MAKKSVPAALKKYQFKKGGGRVGAGSKSTAKTSGSKKGK